MPAVLISFLFTILFWPGISGAAIAPRWSLVAVCAPLFLIFLGTIRLTLGHLLGGLFLAWCFVSLAWTPVLIDGLDAASKLLMLVLVFCIGAQMQSLRAVFIGAALGMTVNSGISIAQFAGWDSWPEVAKPGGLFMNKNIAAEAAVLVFVGAAAHRLWWFLPGIIPSIALTWSRGAILALLAAGAVALWQKSPRITAIAVAVVVFFGALAFLNRSNDDSGGRRMDMWADTVDGMTVLGRGLGSFYVLYPATATRTDTLAARPDHVHNDLLEIAFETGPGVLIFIAFLLFAVFSAGPERYVAIAFVAQGIGGFPFYMPFTAVLFALVAGRLYGARPDLRSEYANGRMALRRWLASCTQLFGSRAAPRGSPAPVSTKRTISTGNRVHLRRRAQQ